jgi:hypothetical protein
MVDSKAIYPRQAVQASTAIDAAPGGLESRLSPAQRIAAVIFHAEHDAVPGWLREPRDRPLRGG